MRKTIIAGNWKMNTDLDEGLRLARQITNEDYPDHVEVILCTPSTHLFSVSSIVNSNSKVHLGAQNCHEQPSGAYTGEISTEMVKSAGATHVIIGHSERREYFHEDHDQLKAKTEAVLKEGLVPIFCCGEKLDVREAGKQEQLVGKQLEESLFGLEASEFAKIIIAYEPVWAIGTGVTASPAQAQDMHAQIRKMIQARYGKAISDKTIILYGGSMKPANAKELLEQEDVDGGLVGGASLKAETFIPIIESA